MTKDSIKELRINGLPIDGQTKEYLSEISKLNNVKRIAVFPDTHTKDKYIEAGYKVTIPSSIAIASSPDVLYPQFRSRGINCGMMVVSLPIDASEVKEEFVKDLFNEISYKLLYYLMFRLRLPFLKEEFDLSKNNFVNILSKGPKHFSSEFDSSNFFGEVDLEKVKDYLNENWLYKRDVRLRHSFGRYFGGNHFIEISKVKNSSSSSTLKNNQATILFHNSGESLEDILNPELNKKYIKTNDFVSINSNNVAFKTIWEAHKMLMNYGSAYRFATFLIIKKVFKKYYGNDKDVRIVLDRGHNYISKEKINNKDYIIYRHGAEKIKNGELSIVSGTKDSSSFIVQGMENTPLYLNSIDHGLGEIINRNKNDFVSTKQKVKFIRFKKGLRIFKKSYYESLKKYANTDKYLNLIESNKLAKPVAELEPLFNMKFE